MEHQSAHRSSHSGGGRNAYYETMVPEAMHETSSAEPYTRFHTETSALAGTGKPKQETQASWNQFRGMQAAANDPFQKTRSGVTVESSSPAEIATTPRRVANHETMGQNQPRRSFQDTIRLKQVMFHKKEGQEAFEARKYSVAEESLTLALHHSSPSGDPTLKEQAKEIQGLLIDTYINLEKWDDVISTIYNLTPQVDSEKPESDSFTLMLKLRLGLAHLCHHNVKGRRSVKPGQMEPGIRDRGLANRRLLEARSCAWSVMDLTSTIEAGETESLQLHQDATFLMSKISEALEGAAEARFYRSLLPEGFVPHSFGWLKDWDPPTQSTSITMESSLFPECAPLPSGIAREVVPDIPWTITAAEKYKFDQLFEEIDVDRKGFITGKEAVPFFARSKLSPMTLGTIWGLSDITTSGDLNKEEFAVMMYLIGYVKISGRNGEGVLPDELPLGLVPPSLRDKWRNR